jgi:iron(III) transport system permease protein
VTAAVFFTPVALLGLGMVRVYNRAATAWIYDTVAILVVGEVVRHLVLGIRAVAAVASQLSPRFEEVARVAGASYPRRLLRIVMPACRSGIIIGLALGFTFALRDLELPATFYPPGREPLSVRIFTLEPNGPAPVVAALALVQCLLAVLGLVAFLAFSAARRSP